MPSILADFPTWSQAKAAYEDLREAGYEELQIDRIHDDDVVDKDFVPTKWSSYGYTNQVGQEMPFTSFTSWRPGNAGLVSGGVLLTVVCADDQIERAVDIIKKHGGTV